MEDPYTTAPLSQDTSTPQFRLLELHPSSPSNLVTCSLRSYSFDMHYPAYKALSYTWGLDDNLYPILLNGILFRVRRSLWSFLEEMRLQGQYGIYWIDAICINQNNSSEKNHQVQMMRRIYSTAERTVIWLGEASGIEMSDVAMEMLACLYEKKEGDMFLLPQYWDQTEVKSVDWLLRRAYWTRVWIIQETMVAKDITVHCGSKSFEWQALRALLFYLTLSPDGDGKSYHEELRHLYATLAMRLVSDREKTLYVQQRRDITKLLSYYRYCDASNILDKVYALCGLACDGGDIIIDYDISPRNLVAHLLDRAPPGSSLDDLRALARAAYVTMNLHWTEDDIEALFKGLRLKEKM
jgi:hypothetical protein